jgi:hypothetical protein
MQESQGCATEITSETSSTPESKRWASQEITAAASYRAGIRRNRNVRSRDVKTRGLKTRDSKVRSLEARELESWKLATRKPET